MGAGEPRRRAAREGGKLETAEWLGMARVGVIARVQGNRGEVVVNPDSSFPERRFRPDGRVWMCGFQGPIPVRMRAVRFQRGRPVVGFEGVASIAEAEALVGEEIRVPLSELVELPPGHVYRHELIGCEVETLDGRALGRVTAVEGPMEGAHLVVGYGRHAVLIPLAEAICVRIDLAARRIRVDPPDGLIDLNRPL